VTNPAEKARTRYLVIRLESREAITREELIRAIRKASRTFGEGYYEEVGPWLTYYEGNHGVIKYNHRKKAEMLALVKELRFPGKAEGLVVVRTLGISGTINKARKKYIP